MQIEGGAAAPPLELTLWEATVDPTGQDQYGMVSWPGGEYLAERLSRETAGEADGPGVAGSNVLALGCGAGLEVLACCSLGATGAVALDFNPLALELLRASAEACGVESLVQAEGFDLLSDAPLPPPQDGAG